MCVHVCSIHVYACTYVCACVCMCVLYMYMHVSMCVHVCSMCVYVCVCVHVQWCWEGDIKCSGRWVGGGWGIQGISFVRYIVYASTWPSQHTACLQENWPVIYTLQVSNVLTSNQYVTGQLMKGFQSWLYCVQCNNWSGPLGEHVEP